MFRLKLSNQLRQITKNYRFVKDRAGMSPARVYKLIGRNENLYLKISSSPYHGTTYDVEREKDNLLWLNGKLPVPEVLHFENYENVKFLLMREVEGVVGDEDYQHHRDPQRMIEIYCEGLKLLQALSPLECPFNNNLEHRLNELDYLVRHNLADVETANWEAETPFQDPETLLAFLKTHQPDEELVFSHGDFGDSNLFLRGNQISGFIDVGRSGKADRWLDIAFCVRSIRNDLGPQPEYLDFFFSRLGIQPDWEKIKYYLLLDELF